MKKETAFIKNGIYLLIILFLCDYIIGTALNHFYFKRSGIDDTTTTYVADQCNQELLIFGSSRASYHYISNEISAKTHMSCFNAGLPGRNIFYYYAMLKCVLARYTPKEVILDIVPDEFKVNDVYYDRLAVLLPYYQNHKEIRSIIRLKSKFEGVKLLSKIYPFNNLFLEIVNRNLHQYVPDTVKKNQNGFVPQKDTIKISGNKFINDVYDDSALDNTAVNFYKMFLNECVKRHIKLYVFVSPSLTINKYQTKTILLAQKIAAANNITFLNYFNTASLKNKNYFYDSGHLNFTGAKLYTAMVETKL